MNQMFRDFGSTSPPDHSGQLDIGAAVAICAVATFAYSILLILGVHVGGVAEEMTRYWVEICSIITTPGRAGPSTGLPLDATAFNLALYRNISVVSVGIALLLFFSLRKARQRWAIKKMRLFWRVCRNGRHEELAPTGYYQLGLGTIAMGVLLFLGDPSFTETAALFSEPWSFLRVPILGTLAFAFACNAASLKLAARIPDN